MHLVNGVFGTLCIGLFTDLTIEGTAGTALKNGFFVNGDPSQLVIQATGVLATAAYVIPVSLITWLVLKAVLGLRVTKEEELEGLDQGEHGNEAYPGFVMQAPSH